MTSNAKRGGSFLRLGGSLTTAVGAYVRAPTARAAPFHGHPQTGHIPHTRGPRTDSPSVTILLERARRQHTVAREATHRRRQRLH